MFLGRVGRPHGVDGELYVDRTALSPDGLTAVGELEWRGPRGARRTLVLHAVRATHDRLLVRFKHVHDREHASRLTNGEIWGDADKLPDPGPGVVYTFQLVGLTVTDARTGDLGVLQTVTFNGGQPLYVVVQGKKERILPGYEPFLKRVDLANRVIEMDLPPGFEDLDT